MTLASRFPLKKKEATFEKGETSSKFEEEREEKKEAEDKNESGSIKIDDEKKSNVKKTRNQEEKEKMMEEKRKHWDSLRKLYTKNFRSEEHMDSVDWEAVRVAKPSELAEAIAARGQHNIIARRIQV